MSEEKDMCSTLEGPFKILTNKFRPQFNETIKSLQFWKLSRQEWENVEQWKGRLQIWPIECNYQKLDRQLKEKFIHSLNGTDMPGEIIWELIKVKENRTIMSKIVLAWAKRVEAQTAQSAIMKGLTEAKEFDKIKVLKNAHIDSPRRHTRTKTSTKQACRYCSSSHPPRQ